MLQRQCGELISLVGSLMALGRCGLAYVGFRLTHWTPATYCLQDRSGGRFCLHTRVCVGVCQHPPKGAFVSLTAPHPNAAGSSRLWSSGTRPRCVWRTSAISWRTMPRTTSTLTSPTAPMRSTSSAPCRSCREWGPCAPSRPTSCRPHLRHLFLKSGDRVSLLQEQQCSLPRSA